MNSEDILLAQLPDELKQLVKSEGRRTILDYFFEYDIEERRIADALSRYAIVKDNCELHMTAADVYEHCLPYLDDSFQLVFYHQWRVLELNDFKDKEQLQSFLDYQTHPDFTFIPNEYYDFVEGRLSVK